MKISSRTVFILGAGFTKAFVPNAPLLEDNYDIEQLSRKFNNYPHAKEILEKEQNRRPSGKIDIERLMTRLQGQMPYDMEHGASNELASLLSEVKQIFIKKITEAKSVEIYREELANFAKLCIDKGITCITFNYDDVLDEELSKLNPIINRENPYWELDGGYGFFCRPSVILVSDILHQMNKTSMLLLKLHGSINWRVRRGYSLPYTVDAIVHHENWHPHDYILDDDIDYSSIEMHLDKDPFIVPPLLTKESLINQPILSLIWSRAFNALSSANQVVFVGYSLPITDFASGFLFSEAISASCKVRVVNFARTSKAKAEIRKTYRKIFPNIPGYSFNFDGTLKWSQDLTS